MKTSVEPLEPVKVKLTVEVEPKRVKRAFDTAARELAKQVNVPGFRPGKAPRRLIEQRFGSGVIAQTAMEEAVSEYYGEALRAEGIDPVAPPEVDVEVFDEAEGCTFTALVEVRPTFEVPDHTGIDVTFPEWEADDEEIAAQLESMRERFAEVDEVDRAAGEGDLVTIDLRVEVDGEELESARVEDALYEVGSGGVTPKLDEEVVGAVAGDEVTYVDALPEEFPEHGGAEATFHVTVKDVRQKTLPDLDDDFAMTASAFETLDELREDLRSSLLRRNIEQAQHQLRGRVLEAYLARVDVPIPPSMIESEQQQRIHQLEHQAEQYGVDVETLLEAQGTTREDYTADAARQAEDAVKAQLVLDALAREIGVDLQSEDIDREIVRHAQSNNVEPEQIARIIQEQGSLPALVGDILRRKTIDAMVDAADVDGGPDADLLIELGLREAPEAVAASDAAAGAPADDSADASADDSADDEPTTS